MLLFLAVLASLGRAQDAYLKLVKAIPLNGVEGRIDHLTLTPDGNRLFVAALGNNTVEVLDPVGGRKIDAIKGFAEPQGVFYIPESKKLAVASGGDDKVRIYDEALKLLGTVDGLPDADNVRYDSQAKLLYVGYGSGALAVIDPDKPSKVADIKLDGHPESFRLETAGTRIFVNVPSAGQIEVVDRVRRQVMAKWPLTAAKSNFPMFLDEKQHRLFVGCRSGAKLLVLDTQTGKLVADADCAGDTDDLFYDAAHRRILITGGAGVITVVEQADADHYRVIDTVKTAAGGRTSLFSPELGLLFLAVPHRGDQRAEIRVYMVN
jgi:YVTN family beta-propeller protein